LAKIQRVLDLNFGAYCMDFTSMRMKFLDRKIKDVISYCWACEEEVMAFESLVKCASKLWSNFCGHQQAPKN
jgi:hypothetical protein